MLIYEKNNINILVKKTFYPTLLFWLKERLQTDNSINIFYPTINDFSKIDYNEYIKLIVPFDNDTIYNENGVWKVKQGGSESNLHIITGESDRVNADYNKETGGLRIWDSNFYGGKQTADYDIIDSSVAGIESTDDTFRTTKYIDKFYLQKKDLPNIPVDWEFIDTSDLPKNAKIYKVLEFDKTKYKYKIWIKFNANAWIFMGETPLNFTDNQYTFTSDGQILYSFSLYDNWSLGNTSDIMLDVIVEKKLVS